MWSSISEKARDDYDTLESLMSPTSNFKKYNDELRNRRGPVIPYIGDEISVKFHRNLIEYPAGVIVRDFTFLAENDVIQEGVVQMDTISMLNKRYQYVRKIQSETFENYSVNVSDVILQRCRWMSVIISCNLRDVFSPRGIAADVSAVVVWHVAVRSDTSDMRVSRNKSSLFWRWVSR